MGCHQDPLSQFDTPGLVALVRPRVSHRHARHPCSGRCRTIRKACLLAGRTMRSRLVVIFMLMHLDGDALLQQKRAHQRSHRHGWTGCKSYVGLTTLRRTWLYDRLYGTRDYRKHGGLGQLLQIRARTCSSLVARWSLKAPAIAPTKLFVQLRYLPAPCCSAAGERRIRRIVLLRSASKSRLFRHSRSRALASDMKSSRRPDRGDSARMNVVGEDSLMSRNGETDTGNQILLLNHVRHSAGSGCTTKVRTSSGTVPFGECDRASAT